MVPEFQSFPWWWAKQLWELYPVLLYAKGSFTVFSLMRENLYIVLIIILSEEEEEEEKN